jgi:predicted nucleic acid-binding protein
MQLRVHTPDRAGYSRMAQLLKKYADRRCDWADASLIWLAETLATRRIATVDLADFSVYRIHGRQRFELEIL